MYIQSLHKDRNMTVCIVLHKFFVCKHNGFVSKETNACHTAGPFKCFLYMLHNAAIIIHLYRLLQTFLHSP